MLTTQQDTAALGVAMKRISEVYAKRKHVPLFASVIASRESDESGLTHRLDLQLRAAASAEDANAKELLQFMSRARTRVMLGQGALAVPELHTMVTRWPEGWETIEIVEAALHGDGLMGYSQQHPKSDRIFAAAITHCPVGRLGAVNTFSIALSIVRAQSPWDATEQLKSEVLAEHKGHEVLCRQATAVHLKCLATLCGAHGGSVWQVQTPLRGEDGLVSKIITETLG